MEQFRSVSSDESEQASESRRRSANLRNQADVFLRRYSGGKADGAGDCETPSPPAVVAEGELFAPLQVRRRSSGSTAAREREQLHRFRREAASFLERKKRRASNSSNEDSVALDEERLQRFHERAVSFLDRAYADEPETLVDETPLSPAAVSRASAKADDARSVARDREMLELFHQEAMSFLEAAANDDATFLVDDGLNEDGVDESGKRSSSAISPNRRSKGRYTAMRIKKDKQRLEQHYRDAMSFLERAEAGDRGVLVEEQELDGPTLERVQLKDYAREAMSFLDKAFRQDSSVLIDDGEKFVGNDEDGVRQPPNEQQPDASEEDKSIAQDRAALERYDEEIGDFMSRALNDDSTLIVEDVESETRRSERGLYARPMIAPSNSSQDSASHESTDLYVDDLSDEVHTDDEFQDPTVADSVSPAPRNALQRSCDGEGEEEVHTDDEFQDPAVVDSVPSAPCLRFEQSFDDGEESEESDAGEDEEDEEDEYDEYMRPRFMERVQSIRVEDQHSLVRRRMQRYELEAADFLDGANVSDDEDRDEDDTVRFAEVNHVNNSRDNGRGGATAQRQVEAVGEENFGADQEIEDGFDDAGADPRYRCEHSKTEVAQGDQSHNSASAHGHVPLPIPVKEQSSKEPDPSQSTPLGPSKKDMVVNLILEDNSGKSQEWSEVPLERSFYRQLPRGSTVRIRPRDSMEVNKAGGPSSVLPRSSRESDISATLKTEISRIASERDAVIAALEDIVNERSMLAAQVGEMKEMIAGAVGHRKQHSHFENSPSSRESDQDIDLSAELRKAYETMRNMTEETEETLNYVESRREEAERGKNTAERRMLECVREIAELRQQLTKQEEIAANDVDGARFSRASSVGSSVTRTTECDGSCPSANKAIEDLELTKSALVSAERRSSLAEQRVRIVKEEAQAQYRAAADREDQLAMRNRQLEARLGDLEQIIEEERGRALHAQMRKDSAEHKARQLQKALEAAENNLLNERCDLDTKIVRAVEKMRAEKDNDIKNLVIQLEKIGAEAREASVLKGDARKNSEALRNAQIKQQGAEEVSERLRQELGQLNENHRGVLAQLRETRDQYEESLRARAANVDQSKDVLDLQQALQGLRGEAHAREEKLRGQLELFKGRTEEAEKAATTAEENAHEAAEAAAVAHKNVQTQTEFEKKARKAAEEQRDALQSELKAREKELVAVNEKLAAASEAIELAKSSSRRGLKKSASKAIARKRKDSDRAGAGNSDEGVVGGRRKGRFRIFG